ncbi:hypothetical protein KAFR_0B05220 [Kazachstania africana CBS 2517]|uniref:Guanine nucleotide-exchange factor SEC12 n=1 Tax=Kazachstania africana (strain ATCC 22294 / BCRC 22015 / CBS 2517 / CECT 1963 / NBRC 1671 / NRRL Y-8276) TaxID=1071382 RepID=H2AR18_KAZAF|nr:hypothetical protein KAFR_0B05220 [Kazachstania africana CBS 2517]CCF56818.1 hypothetical protein KAFR_0B05220 [Kazachstania africana CBS 2517]
MLFKTSLYNGEYPIYGAKFLDENTLLIGGGGGEGNNGIPNKLTTFKIDLSNHKTPLKKLNEIELDPNDDSPTSLDASHRIIVIGCNENSNKVKANSGNKHVRKFKINQSGQINFVKSEDFDKSRDPDDYTKLVYLSRDGTLAAVASSKVPSIIRIIDADDLTEIYEIDSPNEVKDLHFSSNGKVLAYITQTSLEVISTVTGTSIVRKVDFDSNWSLSKIRFIDDDDSILIAASLIKGTGIILIKLNVKSGKVSISKSKVISKKFRGITSMDLDLKGQIAAFSTNDNSVILVKMKDLSIGKIFNQVHSFAVTKVAFSPDSKYLASVSASNSVHIVQLPQNYSESLSLFENIINFIKYALLILLISMIVQYSYQHNMHAKVYAYIMDNVLSPREANAPKMLTKTNYLEQTALIGTYTESYSP